VKTLFVEPCSSWENGFMESFNEKMRGEHLNRKSFDTLFEARILTERWRKEYNTKRPHSSLGYLPQSPETILPVQTIQIDLSHNLSIFENVT